MFKGFSDYLKYKKQEKAEFISMLDELVKNIVTAELEFKIVFEDKNAYVDVRKVNDWKNKFSATHDNASSYLKGGMIEKKKLPGKYEATFKRIVDLYSVIDSHRKKHNKAVVMVGKDDATAAFAKICPGCTPTEKQLNAILGDDKRILFSGAPSTGKTTALLAKSEFLKSKGNNVLLLNGGKLDDFTAISYEILKKAGENVTKTPCEDMTTLIKNFINNKLSDSSYRGRLIDYYFNFHSAGKSVFDFDTAKDYEKYISLYQPITLNGEKVKSYEELAVANFLFSIGVNYDYNAPFAKDCNLQGARSRYKPDFTLPDYNICINIYEKNADGNAFFEDNGITSVDGLGNSTDFLNNRILEIRELHSKAEIPLIECYTYEKEAGNMLSRLQNSLSSYKVNFNIKTDDELLKCILERDKNFIDIIAESIKLSIETILATGENEETILTLSRTKSKASAILYKRRERMLSLILPFFNYYKDVVKWDDFSIIRHAANKLTTTDIPFDYNYILVDDAENLNAASALLLSKIVEKYDCKIVFAGCDWTSAVGIAGIDPVYLRDFGRFFPGYDEVTFDKVMDVPYSIYSAMVDFALNDSGNYEYNPTLNKNYNGSASGKIEKTTKSLQDVIEAIPADKSILVLYRYEHEFASLKNISTANKNINYSSIFDSCGKYDVVIWTSTKYTDFGFPDERICLNNISDLILRRPDTYFFIGERNLLCKAVSHTKDRFIFVCDNFDVSDYIIEITED